MLVMQRYRILCTFQVKHKKTILEEMEPRGSEVGEQVNCVHVCEDSILEMRVWMRAWPEWWHHSR